MQTHNLKVKVPPCEVVSLGSTEGGGVYTDSTLVLQQQWGTKFTSWMNMSLLRNAPMTVDVTRLGSCIGEAKEECEPHGTWTASRVRWSSAADDQATAGSAAALQPVAGAIDRFGQHQTPSMEMTSPGPRVHDCI